MLFVRQVSHNASRFAYDRPMSMARVDNFSVNTFLTLLATLGEDTSDNMVAFKTKQVRRRCTSVNREHSFS